MELRLMIDISDEFYFNFFLFLHFVGWMGFFSPCNKSWIQRTYVLQK